MDLLGNSHAHCRRGAGSDLELHLDCSYDPGATLNDCGPEPTISEKGKTAPLQVTTRWVERTNTWHNAH